MKSEKLTSFISLNEMAKEFNFNKSKLRFYVNKKLLSPITSVGRMQVFDKDICVKKIKIIIEAQKDGKLIKEIRELLKKK